MAPGLRAMASPNSVMAEPMRPLDGFSRSVTSKPARRSAADTTLTDAAQAGMAGSPA